MRHIHLQPEGRIPCDEEFDFRTRAKALVDKWHLILRNHKANKEAGSGANDTPATAPSEADKAEQDAPNGAAATSATDVPVADGTTSVVVTMTET
jgi:hypothetical protein